MKRWIVVLGDKEEIFLDSEIKPSEKYLCEGTLEDDEECENQAEIITYRVDCDNRRYEYFCKECNDRLNEKATQRYELKSKEKVEAYELLIKV